MLCILIITIKSVDIENLTEREPTQIHCYYEKLADFDEEDEDFHSSHFIDIAKRNTDYKRASFKKKPVEWLQKQK